MRICITGGPRTGKTTLAASEEFGGAGHLAECAAARTGAICDCPPVPPVTGCDAFIDLGWSEASAHIATLLSRPGPWVVEGVQVPRALRKFIEAHPGKRPCDRLVILNTPRVELTAGQAAMAKGVHTVLAEVLPQLRALGVEIEERR